MTDFLDRFGAQLREADLALAIQGGTARRRRHRLTRRTSLIVLVSTAIAVPALAATTLWQPVLGRPELHRGAMPNGTSESAPPRDQLAAFGVLRRPQNEQDRGAAAQAFLQSLGPEQGGVRLNTVRLLTAVNGKQAVLVSNATAGLPSGPAADKTSDELCLLMATGGLCGSGPDLLAHGLLGTGDGVIGLVPDGVEAVLISYPSGQTYKTPVKDNFFWAVDAPTVKRMIPGSAPMREAEPFRSIQWLDASGRTIRTPFPVAAPKHGPNVGLDVNP
jgi:hypothetical protein